MSSLPQGARIRSAISSILLALRRDAGSRRESLRVRCRLRRGLFCPFLCAQFFYYIVIADRYLLRFTDHILRRRGQQLQTMLTIILTIKDSRNDTGSAWITLHPSFQSRYWSQSHLPPQSRPELQGYETILDGDKLWYFRMIIQAEFNQKMAQKLGLALVALFGLVQCEVAILGSIPYGLINLALAPAGIPGNLSHQNDQGDEEGQGPKLGESDPHLGIVNFAKSSDIDHSDSFGQIVKPNDNSHSLRPASDDSSDYSKTGGEGFGDNKEAASWDSKVSYHYSKGYDRSGDNSSPNQQANYRPPVRVVVTQAVNTINVDSNFHEESHNEDQDENPPAKVAIPIFTNLNYVDTDSHGDATKAPITVVTAPLVSTAETQTHEVPINQVLGKSDCPECAEENKDAAQTKNTANQALQRDDNLLKTEIKAPIKNVHVPVEQDHSSATSERHMSRGGERRSGQHKRGNGHSDSKTESDNSESKTQENNFPQKEDSHQPKYSGQDLNQKAVNSDLALGQARENAPFVVNSVVIPAQGNLRDEQDDQDNSRGSHN